MTLEEQIEVLRPYTAQLLKEVYEKSLGITDALRALNVGDTCLLTDVERPNIHAIATRVGRKVKASKQKDGSFLVKCTEIREIDAK